LDKFALKLHRMGLGSVAIFVLEGLKPFSNLLLNLGVFGRPIMDVLIPGDLYDRLLEVLQSRESVEYLISKLEELEDGTLAFGNPD